MNKKGFTLVELISVVVLLSIILILVIPAYTQIEGQIKNSNLNYLTLQLTVMIKL